MHPIPGPLATELHVRGKGGIRFLGRLLSRDEEVATRSILRVAHIDHAEVIVRRAFDDTVLQRQVDGDVPMPIVLLGTRVGAAGGAAQALRDRWPDYRSLAVDTSRSASLESVSTVLLEALGLVDVALLERPAADADRRRILVHEASSVAQVMERAGGSPKRLKGARIWGASVARPGQSVSVAHLVEKGDRIYLQF